MESSVSSPANSNVSPLTPILKILLWPTTKRFLGQELETLWAEG
jgi:hypothetical protein